MDRTSILYLFAALAEAMCGYSFLFARKRRNRAAGLAAIGLLAVLCVWFLFTARQAAFWRMAAAPIGGAAVYGMLRLGCPGTRTAAFCDAVLSYTAAQAALAAAGMLAAGLGLERAPLWVLCTIAGLFVAGTAGALALFLRRALPAWQLHFGYTDAVCTALAGAGVVVLGFAGGEYPLLPAANAAARVVRAAQLAVCCGAVCLLAAQRLWRGQTEAAARAQQLRQNSENRYDAFLRSRAALSAEESRTAALAHELSILQGEPDPAKAARLLQDAQAKLRRAATHNATGSPAMDALLAQAQARCCDKKVSFTAFAEGAYLAFLPEEMLCALVGGMLDYAIDAAVPGPGPGMMVRVEKRQAFVWITAEYPLDTKKYAVPGKKTAPEQLQENPAFAAAYAAARRYGGGLAIKSIGGQGMVRAVLPLSAPAAAGANG